MGVAGAVDRDEGVRLGAPTAFSQPIRSPRQPSSKVDAVLEAALGEAGVDVVGKEAAENLAGVAGCGEERERGDEQELACRPQPVVRRIGSGGTRAGTTRFHRDEQHRPLRATKPHLAPPAPASMTDALPVCDGTGKVVEGIGGGWEREPGATGNFASPSPDGEGDHRRWWRGDPFEVCEVHPSTRQSLVPLPMLRMGRQVTPPPARRGSSRSGREA